MFSVLMKSEPKLVPGPNPGRNDEIAISMTAPTRCWK